MEETQTANRIGRDALANWQNAIQKNIYSHDSDLVHTIRYWLTDQFANVNVELEAFGDQIVNQLEPLVTENNLASNLPRIEAYNGIGENLEQIIHHPSYIQAGNIIYGSKLLSHLSEPGGLLHCLSLFFLSSQAGEAGHNCPIACSAGIIRVLQKVPNFPNKTFYLEKLISASYETNFTGAQFLTEIQGGSDVGQNAAYAKEENNIWRIYGEKWFCSNANADLIFVTARFDENTSGTKGLGLFLIPAIWNNKKNNYTFRRLKDKLGTRTMATAEIDFQGAFAYPMGKLEDGFRLVMENVLHLSRIFNSFCVLGMARRAYFIARMYAQHRIAFSQLIINYPAVKENLARIKAENTAMLAAIFATAHLQDEHDCSAVTDTKTELLLRLLVNIQKYFTAKLSVEHIHHALDILAGNGTIETFSSLPRLFRDCIVCENWEGTHNVLYMQVLKDMHKYAIDQIFLSYMHDEINKLDKKSPYTAILNTELTQLEKFIEKFHQLENKYQTLQIHIVVNRMAVLFCAFCLFIEALDQLKHSTSSSKLSCLQYFLLLHINKDQIVYDENYLELLTMITVY